jgi:fibrillarin-like rRNA methylase
VTVLHVEQALVRDRDAVGVAADVLEDLLRTSEQRQSILPIVTEKRLSSTTRIIL